MAWSFNLQHITAQLLKHSQFFSRINMLRQALLIVSLPTNMITNSRFRLNWGFFFGNRFSIDHKYWRPRFSHVQNTNFLCANISLNFTWLSTKFIYIIDLDTLLQLLIDNKAYYLEIKAGYDHFYTTLLSPAQKNLFNSGISGCRRGNPMLYLSKSITTRGIP